MKLKYPTSEKIVEFNALALEILKVKKGDKPEVLSYVKINIVIENCKKSKGDLYDKAVILLIGLIQSHAFASGNRRTAFIVTKEFLLINKGKFNIHDNPKYARIMIGIREKYYKNEEIKEWIKNGKIKKFERF